ncbi:hypothetical protein VYU27_008953 [Nannochloropsis oceanica]
MVDSKEHATLVKSKIEDVIIVMLEELQFNRGLGVCGGEEFEDENITSRPPKRTLPDYRKATTSDNLSAWRRWCGRARQPLQSITPPAGRKSRSSPCRGGTARAGNHGIEGPAQEVEEERQEDEEEAKGEAEGDEEGEGGIEGGVGASRGKRLSDEGDAGPACKRR